ncbi:right-handed parallel beta-helix repeat-containing protein [Carboxylicivirga sp. N1Y90]|uniref:right-handed parallel beta-helix repeat-containing protein n=1 Tax=Carboxylicivirga fragile TaxID=3417571 RepID=UPI003D340929|nr:right-handed parallel beta-helix repeat-containing protein [Marinilabiliaceae bacterium N1Y90]
MKQRFIYFFVLCFFIQVSVAGTNYYVSTEGSDSNNGTSVSTPFGSITKGISLANAGDIIYVRGGEYKYDAKISLSRDGTLEAPIRMEAFESEIPIIDFSDMAVSSSNRGFSLSGDYWVIKGLKIQYAGDNGMFVSGNNNTVENCVFFANNDTGLQLGNGASNNQIINCDSYGNADPTDYGDADGFACKMDVGDNNYFYGCRAWLNVDDGWDGYLRGADDVNTTIENCWTWMNGYFLDGTDAGSKANGNGFKVGGSDDKTLMHNFTLINCVAFDNKSKGFDQNNNRGDINFFNCTGFRNEGKDYSIPLSLNSGKQAEVVNCISIDGDISLGSFVAQQTNSWNGFVFSNSDFVSLDTTGVSGARKADGSLPDLGVFKLVEGSDFINAGTDLGYAYYGNAPDLGAFESNFGATWIDDPNMTEFVIMGNPVNQNLRFKMSSDKMQINQVKIISISGQVVLSKKIEFINHNMFELDVRSLSPGLYVLAIESNTGMWCQKFTKAN